ncbi:hypothetical protein N7520_004056 [Penicillium odoratum]|uniref:uncharacterized protein n=1 Tax=Penicillium odoratum TaxID=1167516 RepID=UPI002546EB93|nr:uncharacterized protein N7520_004056 [Penicillium odoratum]KAJ5769497.1 hypothetical protein N7520_004056 [Penicillium odoratum]
MKNDEDYRAMMIKFDDAIADCNTADRDSADLDPRGAAIVQFLLCSFKLPMMQKQQAIIEDMATFLSTHKLHQAGDGCGEDAADFQKGGTVTDPLDLWKESFE